MSYTIYPDELFVTNLVMDYYLLRLVKKLCGGRAGVLASLGGAAFGALSYCMLILFPVSFPVNTLLAYVAINTIMVRFGCGLRTPGRLCGGIAGLYIAGFLMGGMLEVLKRFLGFAGTKEVLLAGTVCYLVYAAVLPRYREWRKKSRIRCRVRLQMEGQITEVNAFFDTGNSLYDPIAQKLWKSFVMQIQWKNYGNFRGERQKKNQLCRFGVCIHIFWLIPVLAVLAGCW